MTEAASGVVERPLAANRAAEEARMTVHRLASIRQTQEASLLGTVDRLLLLNEQERRGLLAVLAQQRAAGATFEGAYRQMIRDLEALSRQLQPSRRGKQPGQISMAV